MKKRIIYLLFLLVIPTGLLAQPPKTVGATGADYQSLNEAFFDINNGILKGNITLQIIDNTIESLPAELFESGYGGSSDYSSITIYPTISGLTITGDLDGPMINLNNATNVTIDGRVSQTGSTADLTITNINTGPSASTIQFINDASNNVITYCNIMGSSSNTIGGVIFFSTSASGTGNDGNTIHYNIITSDPAGRPVNAIYSAGTAGQENSGITVSDNSIYNFFSPSLLANGTSNGIYISSNSTDWTVTGNSFYETTSFVPSGIPTVTYNAIYINNTGTNFTVTGNFIGGSSANCTGTWTKTGAKNNIFYGIWLNVGTGIVSSVQDNTIKNFSWSNSSSASWTGIHIAGGDVNIGTLTGNTIGASSGTGSVTVTSGATAANVYGINIAGTGTVNCNNNTIGSITTSSGPGNANNFTGIIKSAAGTTTINDNIIGSLTQSNSIQAASVSTSNAQSVIGISNSGTGNITIHGNSIVNLTNATTNSTVGTAGLINGIKSVNGTNTITDNTISELTIANANNSVTNTASVGGIVLTGSSLKTVTGNTIYNLKNTFAAFAGNVTGLYFTGNTGANIVNGNFIHSLSVTGATSVAAKIYGILISSGATTYSNNIISLGGNTQTTLYGIYETGAAGNNNNLYFNTVYIGGIPTAGSSNSYALYSAVTTNTRNFRNNIFRNARSNSGATGTHYAAYFNYSTDALLTCNYNDYYVSGTGGVLGNYGGDKAALPIVTTQDAISLAINPIFANGGGITAEDYLPSAVLNAVTGTGITADFNGAARSGTPTMGAFEAGSCTNPTNGGTIASAQTGCVPFDPVSFTSSAPASGYTGTLLEYKWQESITSGVAGFSDIASSNSTTYNPGILTQTTWYKRLARVSCIGAGDWTGAAESNVIMVTVNPLPNTGLTVSSGGPVCSGASTNVTVALSEAGVNYQLRNGITHIGTAVAGTGGSINLPTGSLSATTTFNVLAANAVTSCPAQLTQTATVNINALPNAGLSVNGTGSICNGTSTNITVSLSEIGINYQLRNDNANELVGTPVAGTGGTINLPTGSMTFNIQYNILATNTISSCAVQLTEKEIVSIDPPSVGGSVSGSSPVTYGSSSGTLTLSGNTGIVQRWEKRFNAGSWVTIANTNSTYSETPSSAGTWGYRAVVKSGTCSEANSAEFSLTVNKASLTITADNKNKDYGAALPVFTVTYTGLVNGDLAAATPPGVNTTATSASQVGTYPITASGAADPNYNISYAAGTLTVDKVSLTVTPDNKNKDYGAALPAFTVTYTGLVNGDLAPATPPTVVTTATAASPVGTYPITASGAADPNYNISYVAGTLTVDKVTLTVTPDNKNKDYGAALPVFTVTYSGFVNGDVAPATAPTIVTTATAASPVGTYPITASGAADPNYNISYVAGTLTVDKVILTVTPDNKNKDYGAALPVFTVTYSGFVNGDAAPATAPTVVTTATAASPSGTYPITASGAADPNYNISYEAGTLTVDKVTLTVTPDNKNKDYGAALPAFTVTYTGLVNGDLAPATLPSVVTTATAASPAGTYPITASGAADPNYNISYVAGTLTVDKVTLTVTPDNKNKDYGAALPAFTVTYTGFVNGDLAPATLPMVVTTATAASPAGTYPITASGAADPNYNISYVAGTLTVDKVSLTVTPDNKNKDYGAVLPVFTVAYSGFVNGDAAPATLPTVVTTATAASPAGTYPITASGAADPNYNISYVAGTLTVDKVSLTVTPDNKNKDYGAALPAFTVTYTGLVNGDLAPATPPTVVTTATAVSPVGTYPITASGAADPNYNISYVAGILTIDKIQLTVTADNKNKLYGDALPALTMTFSGFTGSEDQSVLDVLPSLATTALQNSNAGNYPISASGGTDNNYSFVYIDGILTISKTDQTISFGALPNKTYGDADYSVTANASSGLVVSFVSDNPAVATVAGNTIHIAGAGSAVITASQPGDLNYNAASSVMNTLTVNKASLTFKADDETVEYQALIPVLTYIVSGFVNSESVSVLDVLPIITTTAVANSPIGNYPITISGGSDNNYTYIYSQGVLTITRKSQTVTFTDYPEKLLVGDVYTLAGTSTSGLTVQFESMDASVATVSGNELKGVSKGTVQIRAFHPGDLNWDAAEAFATIEIYSTHKDIMYLFTPNNDGFNDQWELPDLAAWGKCDVKVYNRWGKLVFADKNYNNLWEGTSNGSQLPEGAYFFVIKTENAGAFKGTVNIVR